MSHKESIRNNKSIKDTIALTCVCTMSTLQILKYTAGHINYGGCVTDDWDRRCIMNILNDFYRPEVLSDDHIFSESGIYHQMSTDTSHKVHIITFTYVQFICNDQYIGVHVHVHVYAQIYMYNVRALVHK